MKNDVKSKEQIKTWVFYEYTYIVTVPIPSAVKQNCSLDALLPLQKIISIHCWCLSDECSNVLDRLVLWLPKELENTKSKYWREKLLHNTQQNAATSWAKAHWFYHYVHDTVR